MADFTARFTSGAILVAWVDPPSLTLPSRLNPIAGILHRRYSVPIGTEVEISATPDRISARGTLTGSANFSNGETVTIDTKVYTFQTILTNFDGNVFIGAALADSLDNIRAAINLDAGSGTLYAAATIVHPTVSATDTATTLEANAKTPGTGGNSIVTTDTAGFASWGGGTLSGGGAGSEGELDVELSGRLFISDLIEFPIAKPPITNSGGQTSVQKFTGVSIGHYTFQMLRPSGGGQLLHIDVTAS